MGLLETIDNINIVNALLCTLISAVFTLWFIPRILVVSFKKKLFDYSDERKVHTGVVPRLGGVAFVPSIIISISLVVGVSSILSTNEINDGASVPVLQQIGRASCRERV